MQKLLVTGYRRSGTTLLASMLGGHSKISMLNEVAGDELERQIGKPIQGTKLTWPHIKFNKKYTRAYRCFYHKFAWFLIFLRRLGIYWDLGKGSMYSIEDYYNMGAKIVIVHRLKRQNVQSVMNHNRFPRRKAERDWSYFNRTSHEYERDVCHVQYHYLTTYPEECLRNICDYLEIDFEPFMLEAAGLNNTYAKSKIEKRA